MIKYENGQKDVFEKTAIADSPKEPITPRWM